MAAAAVAAMVAVGWVVVVDLAVAGWDSVAADMDSEVEAMAVVEEAAEVEAEAEAAAAAAETKVSRP